MPKSLELDNVNPDWNFALNHGISTVPGIWDQQSKLCPCCHNPIEKQPISMNQNTKQLGFLGFGVPLFYKFLKNCILMLGVYLGTYAGISICWAIQHNNTFCSSLPVQNQPMMEQHQYLHLRHDVKDLSKNIEEALNIRGDQSSPNFLQCSRFFVRLSRTQTYIANDEIVIRVLSFVIQLALLLFGRQKISFITEYYDEITTSMSDYSILLRSKYPTNQLQNKVTQFLKQCFKKQKFVSVLSLPHIQELQELQKKISKSFKQYGLLKLQLDQNKNIKEPQIKQNQLKQKEQQCRNHQEQLQQYIHSFMENEKNSIMQNKINKAIVIMETQRQKFQVLKNYQKIQAQKIFSIFGQKNQVFLEQAPQPGDINWEYVHSTQRQRYMSYVKGCCLSILFISVFAVIFYFALSLKTQWVEDILQRRQQQQYKDQKFVMWGPGIIAILALILVILFNKFIMGKALHMLCHRQQHQTKTTLEFSFALKYSLGMFFTTGLMTLAVQALRFNNFYKIQYGVIEQQSIMFLMTAFLVPIIWFINPFDLFRKIRRYYYRNSKKFTQRQANQLMENFSYDIGKRYAEILEIMWFTYLYSTLIPIGVPLTAIGVFLYYWVDKYNLLRKSSVKEQISGQLSSYALKLLDFTLFLMPLGQIFFDLIMRKTFTFWSVGCLLVSIIFLCLPWQKILNFFITETFKLQQKKFSEAYERNQYQVYHPLYKYLKQHQNQYQGVFGGRNCKPNHISKNRMIQQ